MQKRTITGIVIAVSVLALAGCGKKQDVKLLENAAPENSAMCFYVFDGETTVSKWLFDTDEEKRIISKINALPAVKADNKLLENWKEPCYGISISDKDGYDIWLTYSDGMWLTKDGSLYKAKYDLAGVYDSFDGDENAWESGIAMPNSIILSEYSLKYLKRDDSSDESTKIGLSFVGKEGPVVTVKLENLTQDTIAYGTYFTLEREIDGIWYILPPALSNYAFIDIAIELPAGASKEENCDLTMYGELKPGHYRIEKEHAYAEFEIN